MESQLDGNNQSNSANDELNLNITKDDVEDAHHWALQRLRDVFPDTRISLIEGIHHADEDIAFAAACEIARIYNEPIRLYAAGVFNNLPPHDIEEIRQIVHCNLHHREDLKKWRKEKHKTLRGFIMKNIGWAGKSFFQKRKKHLGVEFDETFMQPAEDEDLSSGDLALARIIYWICIGEMRRTTRNAIRFEKLFPFVLDDGIDYSQLSTELNEKEPALRKALERLRDDFNSRFESHVASSPGAGNSREEVLQETAYLKKLLVKYGVGDPPEEMS